MSEAKVIIKTANIKHRLKLLDALPIKYDVVVKSAYCKEWLLEIFKPRHLCFTEINPVLNAVRQPFLHQLDVFVQHTIKETL